MAYADQEAGGRKVVSIVIVALLHAALAYAFITGLAFNVIKKAASDLKTFDVQDEPPPPPQKLPPPPPVPKNLPPPPIVAPPPIVQTQAPAPVIQTVQAPPPVIHVQAVTAPPPPPAPSKASGAKPRGSFQELMSSDDYPPAALRNNEQGTVGFKLEVGADGRVTNCTVTSSSGFSDLDETACKLLTRRARFTPAKDASGNPMTDTFASRFTWQVPKD
ncbi:MAG: energy transducer TonB [Sphingomonadaceae bacterium]|nr:energy transducer TonB [Sphingomonadaceae bacterium]